MNTEVTSKEAYPKIKQWLSTKHSKKEVEDVKEQLEKQSASIGWKSTDKNNHRVSLNQELVRFKDNLININNVALVRYCSNNSESYIEVYSTNRIVVKIECTKSEYDDLMNTVFNY